MNTIGVVLNWLGIHLAISLISFMVSAIGDEYVAYDWTTISRVFGTVGIHSFCFLIGFLLFFPLRKNKWRLFIFPIAITVFLHSYFFFHVDHDGTSYSFYTSTDDILFDVGTLYAPEIIHHAYAFLSLEGTYSCGKIMPSYIENAYTCWVFLPSLYFFFLSWLAIRKNTLKKWLQHILQSVTINRPM